MAQTSRIGFLLRPRVVVPVLVVAVLAGAAWGLDRLTSNARDAAGRLTSN
jgi:hypothetical protein